MMQKLARFGVVLWCGAALAQAPDPASPRAGNGERGRELLTILGPRPASGFSPLQQQELMRRVRCAGTRQQIQDELDIEAAGAKSSVYDMAELRMLERENCAPVPLPSGAAAAPVVAPPHAASPNWRPPPVVVTESAPPAPAHVGSAPASRPPAVAASATQTAVPATPEIHAMGSAYTPAPEYPPAEKAAGHEGTVIVQLVMNADGSVRSSAVGKSSGFPALDEAAVQATRNWRIPAAAGDGRTIGVPLRFSAH